MITIGTIATTGITTTIGTTEIAATTPLSQDFLVTAAGSIIAGIVVGAVIIIVTLVSIFVCTIQRKQKCLSRKINPWLPRRSHRTLSSNLISDHHELGVNYNNINYYYGVQTMPNLDDEVHAVRTSQNFACSYERPQCTTFTSNERRDNTLTTPVPLSPIREQRNDHYETGSQYVCFILYKGSGYYFKHC